MDENWPCRHGVACFTICAGCPGPERFDQPEDVPMPDQITIPDAAVDFDGEKPWSAFTADSYHRQRYREKARKLLAALPHILPTGEGVRVKPLEWMQETPYLWIADWNGNDYIVRQMVDGTFQVVNRGAILDSFPSEAAAKSAAQSDHETCILSALVPTPPTEAVKPEPIAWKTPYFEKLTNGSLAPILVWGDLKGGDDWMALYAAPPPPASTVEAMEWNGHPTPQEAAAILRGHARKRNIPPGDNDFEDAAGVIDELVRRLASLRSKGGGNGQ